MEWSLRGSTSFSPPFPPSPCSPLFALQIALPCDCAVANQDTEPTILLRETQGGGREPKSAKLYFVSLAGGSSVFVDQRPSDADRHTRRLDWMKREGRQQDGEWLIRTRASMSHMPPDTSPNISLLSLLICHSYRRRSSLRGLWPLPPWLAWTPTARSPPSLELSSAS